jgi:hypothetical protein
MNYSRVSLLAIACVAITGCGKSIPECGDEAVISVVKKLIADGGSKIDGSLKDVLQPHFGQQVNIAIATTVSDLKLDGFVSTNKNKDSGLNNCQAALHGTAVRKVTLTPTGDMGAMFIGANYMALSAEDKALLGQQTTDQNKYILTKRENLPSVLKYSAQMTDKGDQVMVNILPE